MSGNNTEKTIPLTYIGYSEWMIGLLLEEKRLVALAVRLFLDMGEFEEMQRMEKKLEQRT